MVPSFPRKASVDASYKQAMEEKSIGKYILVKRRDQAGPQGIMGWETIESPTKGSGGFQRIQWQCYDKDNYYYSFIAHSDPRQFSQHHRALCRGSSTPSGSGVSALGVPERNDQNLRAHAPGAGLPRPGNHLFRSGLIGNGHHSARH